MCRIVCCVVCACTRTADAHLPLEDTWLQSEPSDVAASSSSLSLVDAASQPQLSLGARLFVSLLSPSRCAPRASTSSCPELMSSLESQLLTASIPAASRPFRSSRFSPAPGKAKYFVECEFVEPIRAGKCTERCVR